MSALAVLLIAVISLAWVYPERLGRWLRKVWNGFGPVEIHKHVYIDAATVAALRAALQERE
ncbi:hypothetical protein [Brucella intermedia]|uniref:hypothetical protein n=1 Tax=Brucella intermedia TaxID=94625 RepID=UPI00124BF4E8|nr:hypothetical protein [Brucella intermedia]KAB2716617.1 hypothetical protein F9K75_11005 [Brucella intermedia]